MKRILLITLFSVIWTSFYTQDSSTEETYFVTMNVRYGLKSDVITHKLYLEAGTQMGNPLYNKIINTDKRTVSIREAGNLVIFNNEIDLLQYLVAEDWEVVTIQQVYILDTKNKQYLMKKVIEP